MKLRLVTVIVVAIVLGIAGQPASANAMIPRSVSWYTGPTLFGLNAKFDDFFPAFLDGYNVPSYCANVSGRPDMSICPSSGGEALAGFASLSSNVGLVGPADSNWAVTSPDAGFFIQCNYQSYRFPRVALNVHC